MDGIGDGSLLLLTALLASDDESSSRDSFRLAEER